MRANSVTSVAEKRPHALGCREAKNARMSSWSPAALGGITAAKESAGLFSGLRALCPDRREASTQLRSISPAYIQVVVRVYADAESPRPDGPHQLAVLPGGKDLIFLLRGDQITPAWSQHPGDCQTARRRGRDGYADPVGALQNSVAGLLEHAFTTCV